MLLGRCFVIGYLDAQASNTKTIVVGSLHLPYRAFERRARRMMVMVVGLDMKPHQTMNPSDRANLPDRK